MKLSDLQPAIESFAVHTAGHHGGFIPAEWVGYLSPDRFAELVQQTPRAEYAEAGDRSVRLFSGLEIRLNELCPPDHLMLVSRDVADRDLPDPADEMPRVAADPFAGIDEDHGTWCDSCRRHKPRLHSCEGEFGIRFSPDKRHGHIRGLE